MVLLPVALLLPSMLLLGDGVSRALALRVPPPTGPLALEAGEALEVGRGLEGLGLEPGEMVGVVRGEGVAVPGAALGVPVAVAPAEVLMEGEAVSESLDRGEAEALVQLETVGETAALLEMLLDGESEAEPRVLGLEVGVGEGLLLLLGLAEVLGLRRALAEALAHTVALPERLALGEREAVPHTVGVRVGERVGLRDTVVLRVRVRVTVAVAQVLLLAVVAAVALGEPLGAREALPLALWLCDPEALPLPLPLAE